MSPEHAKQENPEVVAKPAPSRDLLRSRRKRAVRAKTGAIKLNFPDLEVHQLGESCALDVADRGGTTLEDVGTIMNLTRERIRQVEVKGLAKLQAIHDTHALRDFVDDVPLIPRGKRRLPIVLAREGESDDEDDGVPEPLGPDPLRARGESVTDEYDWELRVRGDGPEGVP